MINWLSDDHTGPKAPLIFHLSLDEEQVRPLTLYYSISLSYFPCGRFKCVIAAIRFEGGQGSISSFVLALTAGD